MVCLAGEYSMVYHMLHTYTFVYHTQYSLNDGTKMNTLALNVRGSRFILVNIMAADALAPYVAKTSAAMILTI